MYRYFLNSPSFFVYHFFIARKGFFGQAVRYAQKLVTALVRRRRAQLPNFNTSGC